ncbi:hypothetical protein PVAP13_7NG265224 [Panicum virgatum]|uniref:Uncharacterized protein n=1 Tax=Panicum virgatum TaxID=38727 RepID=A0A8T0PYR3_PANVG|nr:hypothetical protein PVAP13_7NG265224 [Panicum virgatum]
MIDAAARGKRERPAPHRSDAPGEARPVATRPPRSLELLIHHACDADARSHRPATRPARATLTRTRPRHSPAAMCPARRGQASTSAGPRRRAQPLVQTSTSSPGTILVPPTGADPPPLRPLLPPLHQPIAPVLPTSPARPPPSRSRARSSPRD